MTAPKPVSGVLVSCPRKGCTWEQYRATLRDATTALHKHAKTCKGRPS